MVAFAAFLRRQYQGGPRRWAVVAAWILGAVVVVAAADVWIGTPSARAIREMGNLPTATTVLDKDGKPVFTVFKERRMPVRLADISPHLIHAVLATEDRRFYEHDGLDGWRIGGALVANLRAGGRTQGGSTITQQLARKTFLRDDKTMRRKMREAYLAVRIEHTFSKDEILEIYLNKVYLGDGYYGVEAASRGYFGKPSKALTIDEAALVAGLIQSPSAYAPTKHAAKAIARRAVVLRQMVDAGYLDADTAGSLEKADLHLANGFGTDSTAQYFKNHIVRFLVDRFGWEAVSEGGLRVYSTIDMRAQLAAEDAVGRGLTSAEKMRGFKAARRGDPRTTQPDQGPGYLQGALVAIDPSNGEVRALVGGRNFSESQFDRATQARRQPGSAFKPFVFAAALESGASPATVLTDLDDVLQVPEGAWRPADGHSSMESMTMRTALRISSNRAAVQVLKNVGISRAVAYATRMGLETPPVPSLVLGTGDVTVLSMTTAYGAFANGGWVRPPVFIRKIEDRDGKVLYKDDSHPSHAITEETAFLMANMLADVVNRGTGYRARQAGFRHHAAGKTGTTNDYHDAWFIGFTPALVASVWVGFDDPKTIVPGGHAGDIAAPMWGRFMQQAVTKDAGWIKRPNGITSAEICRESGLLPGDGCYRAFAVKQDGTVTDQPVVGTEYFRRGTQPTDYCAMHGTDVRSPDAQIFIRPAALHRTLLHR
jgi:1A family penicillin-binding protein